jgi:hypothetical protein
VIAFTFTGAGARRPFLGDHWPPAGEWADLGRGSRIDHLPVWIAAELWLVELDGSVHEVATQLRADRGRLVRRISGWDEGSAADFARSCAARILELAPQTAGADDPRIAAYRADAEAVGSRADANVAGWVATRAAAAVAGAEGAAQERARQAQWLRDRLELDAELRCTGRLP